MELMVGHKFISTETKIKIAITKIEDNIAYCDRFFKKEEKLSPCSFSIEYLSDFLSSGLIAILIEEGDIFISSNKIYKHKVTKINNKIINTTIVHNTLLAIGLEFNINVFTDYIKNNELIPYIEFKSNIDLSMFPHTCPLCGKPAYISGLQQIDCSNCNGRY